MSEEHPFQVYRSNTSAVSIAGARADSLSANIVSMDGGGGSRRRGGVSNPNMREIRLNEMK